MKTNRQLLRAALAVGLALAPLPPSASTRAQDDTLACAEITTPGPVDSAALRDATLDIARTWRRWAEAIRTEDAESLVGLVTADAEFWSRGTAPLRGRDALADAFRPFFDRFNMEQDFECVEAIVSGDLAILRGLEVNRLVEEATGDTLTVLQRAFSVMLRESDGEWRFARGMTNLPQGAAADTSR